ncbi:MAG: hypothetical protein O3C10_03705 [Chloroflexi bacterium]|nr:hypothetical protein [Chloroflexota bacterium]
MEYRTNPRFVPDNASIRFGTGRDARVYYDGTDLVVSPADIGIGDLKVSGAGLLLDSGEMLDFGAGDVTLTHAAAQLRLDGGDLIVTDGDGLVIGHTAQVNIWTILPEFQLLGTGDVDAGMAVGRWSADSNPARFIMSKSRNPAIGSNTIVQDGDFVGSLVWAADDGTNLDGSVARIDGIVDGAPGVNDLPGRLVFLTTADGSPQPTERMRIDSAGGVFIGDTANANMTIGLTINQGANDDAILAFKSSDIAHGMTTLDETDTYARFMKNNATLGTLELRTYAETGTPIAFTLGGFVTDDNTVKDATGRAPIEVNAAKKSGTTVGAQGVDANSFAVRSNASTRFIVDEDGDLLADGGVATTNMVTLYDDLPDGLTARVDRVTAFGGETAEAHRPMLNALIDRGVLHMPTEEGGHPFVSIRQGLYFSWDAAFQNASWIRDVVDVLSDEQRDRLPTRTRELLALMPGG